MGEVQDKSIQKVDIYKVSPGSGVCDSIKFPGEYKVTTSISCVDLSLPEHSRALMMSHF